MGGLSALACVALAAVVTLGMAGSAAAQQQIDGCSIGPQASCPAAELAGENLSMARLRGAELSGANLAGANLRLADLGMPISPAPSRRGRCLPVRSWRA